MATIVVHRSTGQRYVLVGTGYAATETATPGLFFGNWAPDVQGTSWGMVAVCDAQGTIMWADSQQFAVAEIDGSAPSRLLHNTPFR